MQRKCFILILTFIVWGITFPSYGQYLSYEYFLESGKNAFNQQEYDEAVRYFTLAHLVVPTSKEPLFYINLIKRIQDKRVKTLVPQGTRGEETVSEPYHPPKISLGRRKRIQKALDSFTFTQPEVPVGRKVTVPMMSEAAVSEQKVTAKLIDQENVIFELDEEAWSAQPKTLLEIEKNKSLIIEGETISQFLVVTPGIITVERLDRDRIKILPKTRGSTFLHIWDDRGRWTFNVKIIFPVLVSRRMKEKNIQDMGDPFELNYSVSWNSYYRGDQWQDLARQYYSMTQWAEIDGPTPYGNFDTSAAFSTTKETTEVSTYTIGLTNGHIGWLQDFDVRGVDYYKSLSLLSLPGKSLRGILWEAKAFDKKIGYDFFWGKERGSGFGFLTPGVSRGRETVLEGAKVSYIPTSNDTYSFNFARGYGGVRSDDLSERVYAVETKNKFGECDIWTEVGYDEDSFAGYINSEYVKDNLRASAQFRNLEKNYNTVVGLPTDSGEIGTLFSFDWRNDRYTLRSMLDLYRERQSLNPNDRQAINVDFNSFLGVDLTNSAHWQTAFYYSTTPGVLAPWRSLRLTNTYFKLWEMFKDKNLSFSFGSNYQRNRYSTLPSSDYDSFGLVAGISFPLSKSLSYYANYNYTWVKEQLNKGVSSPRVFNTGFNYYKKLTTKLDTNIYISYRDEEDAAGSFSFLAGEDSADAGINLSYRPFADFECFLDSRVKDVWAETAGRDAYNEAEIRWGIRSSWDLPFSWTPQGIITGSVYNDTNRNNIQDPQEQGLAGVKIFVGKKEIITDSTGRYEVEVRAKRVLVRPDIGTVPQGFVVFSAPSQFVEVIQGGQQVVDFALTSHSGIYGSVYIDENGSGAPDEGDTFIPNVSLSLDNKEWAMTNFEGSYFFRDIAPGRHVLTIEVNSLPQAYLPAVKVANEIILEEGTSYIFHIPVKKAE